jgi:hypothetical protein
MAQPAERKTMPTPARNRFVNFTPPAPDKDAVYKSHGNLPFTALITHVWSDRMVNLMVFLPNGDFKPYTSVDLLDGTENESVLKAHKKAGRYAEWPAIVQTVSTIKVNVEADTSKLSQHIDAALASIAAAKDKKAE